MNQSPMHPPPWLQLFIIVLVIGLTVTVLLGILIA